MPRTAAIASKTRLEASGTAGGDCKTYNPAKLNPFGVWEGLPVSKKVGDSLKGPMLANSDSEVL